MRGMFTLKTNFAPMYKPSRGVMMQLNCIMFSGFGSTISMPGVVGISERSFEMKFYKYCVLQAKEMNSDLPF